MAGIPLGNSGRQEVEVVTNVIVDTDYFGSDERAVKTHIAVFSKLVFDKDGKFLKVIQNTRNERL